MVKISPSSGLALVLQLLLAVLAARDVAVHGQTLEAGSDTTYVLGENGTLFAWGESRAILGKEDDPVYGYGIGDERGEMASSLPQFQSKLANITAVSHDPSCLVDGNAPPARAVQCWGSCSNGACGHGRPEDYLVGLEDAPLVDLGSDATDWVVSVKGGFSGHTCVLFASGRVKCWGDNGFGQLGLGDTENRGDDPGEMGHNLPFADLGTGVKAVQLAAGSDNTCAVLEGRRLIKCWGAHYYGLLGQDVPGHVGDEPGEMGDNLPAIDMDDEVEDIEMGVGIVCVLLAETREVKCWGRNEQGSLGAAHEDDVRLANATLPAVSVGGRVAKLAVGTWHSCVILEDDAATVKCWGSNYEGRLGLGLDVSDTGLTPPAGWPDVAYGVAGETAVEISCGDTHTCVRLAGGQVRCWGSNYNGQLGHGAGYFEWGMSRDHMGANLPDSLYGPTPSPPWTFGVNAQIFAGVGGATVVVLAGLAYFRRSRGSKAAAPADAADADVAVADSALPTAVFVQDPEDSNFSDHTAN